MAARGIMYIPLYYSVCSVHIYTYVFAFRLISLGSIIKYCSSMIYVAA